MVKEREIIKPFFSIIIPVYNVGKYLGYCLDAVKGQKFLAFEVVLVDDGSTDGCSDVCDQYAAEDDRFIVLHQKNQGLLQARRNGLKIARGEYIIHIDSDDACSFDLLEELYSAIQESNADLLIYNFELIDECNNQIQRHTPAFGRESALCRLSKKDIINKMLTTTEINTIWMKCAKRNIVDITVDYSRYGRLMMGEDVLQSIPLIENAKEIVYIPKCLYKYRYNRAGMSRSMKKSYIFDFLNVRRRFYNMLQKMTEVEEEDRILLYKNYSHFLINYLLKESLVCQSRKEYLELKKEIVPYLLPINESEYLENTVEKAAWILCKSNLFWITRFIAGVYFGEKGI